MKHPNQSFIDNFNRPNRGPEGVPTYRYTQKFIEKKRKQKFEYFVESLNNPKPKTNNLAQEINRIFSYNTLSKNTNKHLLETKQSIGSLPQQFNYNGLVYVFNKKLNMFVNQHGHVISIEQATAFMEMSSLEEVIDIGLDSSFDGSPQPSQILFEDQTLLVFSSGNPTFPPLTSTSPILGKAYYPFGRISANINKDESLPDVEHAINYFASNPTPMGKRSIFPHPIQSAWNDSFWLGIPGNSVQDCLNINDSCRDPNTSNFVESAILNRTGDQVGPQWAGIQKFGSPWLDNASSRAKTIWYNWLNDLKNNGITFDIVMGNIDDSSYYSPVVTWNNLVRKNADDGGFGYTSHYGHVLNDSRTFSATAGNANIYGPLYNQLKINNGFTLSDFNIIDASQGVSGAYIWWNYITSRMGSYYIDDTFYKPLQELMPNSQVSNYGNYILTPEDVVPDLNGHKQFYENKIGNALGAICYGEVAGVVSNSKIDPTDPTSLVYDPSVTGPQRFGFDTNGNISGWRCFQHDQQMLKALYRNKNPYDYLHVWIKSRRDTNVYAFGGPTTFKRNEYWQENIYHITTLNPDAILYFNQFGGTVLGVNYDKLVTDIIEEVNNLKNNKKSYPLQKTTEKFSFSDYYLASGCLISNNTNLWRVTVNYDFVTNLVINGINYDVSTTPGIWYSSPSNKINFTVSSYNSTSKTLYLII
jgi:hypothetical protein